MPLAIKPHQRYRFIPPQASAAQRVTIEAIEDSNVHGFASPEDVLGAVAAGTWSPQEIHAMTLVWDPDWPVYRLAFVGDMHDDNLQCQLLQVGMFDGGTSHTAAPGGLGPGECYWLVDAPSEDEAIERLRLAAGPLVDPSTIRLLSASRP